MHERTLVYTEMSFKALAIALAITALPAMPSQAFYPPEDNRQPERTEDAGTRARVLNLEISRWQSVRRVL